MQTRDVQITPFRLPGILDAPRECKSIVLFAHGSGSSRLSPRNTMVAAALREAGLGTLLFDLLTESEAADRENVFDIGLLAERLFGASEWVRAQPEFRGARIGYFGASTGAAAALVAATIGNKDIAAIVSRGGRPDLAGAALTQVTAPTLLIVGGNDDVVIELNEAALAELRCEKRLEIVPGATHLFEEPGTLEQVIVLARDWFQEHLLGAALPGRRV